MFKYDGASCPVCSKKFTETDDIVVCPECGAPHHRECYRSLGKCALSDKHGSGQAWQPPKPAESETTSENRNTVSEITCPNCGTKNPRGSHMCTVCGTRFSGAEGNPGQNEGQHFHSGGPDRSGGYGSRNEDGFHYYSGNIPPIPPNPFTTPYGGIDPDEDIDGIPARDLVIFTGQNSFYFLPKFKAFAEKRRSLFPNWSAFLFTYMYYFFRKMYGLGFLILAANLVLSLPAYIINFSTIQEYFVQMGLLEAPMFSFPVTDQMIFLANLFNLILLGLKVLLGLFTNRLYYSHARNKILSLQEFYPKEQRADYAFALARKGRTNAKLILIVVITIAAIYLMSVFLLSSMMMM